MSEPFYFWHVTEFQNQISRSPTPQTTLFPWERFSPRLPAPPRKGVARPTRSPHFIAESLHEVPLLSRASGFYAWEPRRPLVPRILPETQGILRLPGHSWDSAPFRHLSTFNPGLSAPIRNLKVQILRSEASNT